MVTHEPIQIYFEASINKICSYSMTCGRMELKRKPRFEGLTRRMECVDYDGEGSGRKIGEIGEGG